MHSSFLFSVEEWSRKSTNTTKIIWSLSQRLWNVQS